MRGTIRYGWVGMILVWSLAGGVEAQLTSIKRVATQPTVLVIPTGTQRVSIGAADALVDMPTEVVWRAMCGSAQEIVDQKMLADIAATHTLDVGQGVKLVNNGPVMEAGLNVVFQLGPSVPAAAVASFTAAEAYLEAEFPNDTMTITVDVSFAALSPGVIGGTGSASGYLTYADMRSTLVGGKDSNDTIHDFLPTGTAVPVRYAANKTTNENRVFINFAAFKANGGAVTGNDASMQYSTNFPFDYDPSNGVTPNTISLVDVIIHETGHAMGFTSGVDSRRTDIDVLDLFRFRNTDGTSDFNPDTPAEFTVRPRWAVLNNPNDDVNLDVIGAAEYPLSDGNPWQASHFREEVAGTAAIGIMSPAFGYGETFYPLYFRASDLTAFDAIGYDQ